VWYLFSKQTLLTRAWLEVWFYDSTTINRRKSTMLTWAVIFFIIAIIAAIFGFGGIAAGAAGIAKILFIIFIVLFLIALISNAVRGRGPPL
jgi:uncharacterized membrane protein YtjA (UPF0391 family)